MLDVLIIGGGVVGCSISRELSRCNLDIALLEKTEDICNGQSKANTAIVHAGFDAKPGTLKAKFNVLGNKMFDKLAKELDVPFIRNGSLVVAFSAQGKPILEQLKARGEQNGVEGLQIIDHDEILKREANISKKASFALYAPTGGIVCPYELTQAFAENAAQNGVEFYRDAMVTSLNYDGKCWIIESTAGIFKSRAVVNAAGVDSDTINNMVSKNKFNIIPRRGEYCLIDKSYSKSFKSAIFQLPSKMGKGVLVAPTVDGTILIGPTAEDIDDKYDTRTTKEGLDKVVRLAKITWENLPTHSFITAFAGVRSHPDTDDFIIGEAEDANMFFNAAGIESPGLTAAPAIAQHLSDIISKRLKATLKTDFNPNRKSIDKFRNMTSEERKKAIKNNPDYAKIICRCENVTEAEIRESIRRPVGARNIDGIKRRTRTGMGRCQSSFCLPRVVEILSEELQISSLEITKSGKRSKILKEFLSKQGGNQNE